MINENSGLRIYRQPAIEVILPERRKLRSLVAPQHCQLSYCTAKLVKKLEIETGESKKNRPPAEI